ncbi:lytic transglycosylase domain-containing protein [Chryseolinea sp. T2]|uniref:lytic transglycosylase domain-containing protein n=1 Tax=Chryseolinea sp. T2 TaxID=3129255 RepID=UPI0030779DF0
MSLPKIPGELTFCGEPVPLHDPDIKERLERELIVNVNKHASTILILKESGRWNRYLQAMLDSAAVPKEFFYLAVIESELDPMSRSGAGATGLWHFTVSTAKEYGLEISEYVDERRDAEKSTRAASEFFKRAYKKYGSWTLAAAAFNRGSKGIENAVKGQQTNNYYELYLNEETARYVYRILALKLIIEAPEKYGYNLTSSDYYQPVEYKTVIINDSIPDLPKFAKSLGVSYLTLKEHNPWIQNTDYKLVLQQGKKYKIRIPAK